VTAQDQYASVRYLVTDVQAAIDFYTGHLGFTLNTSAAPAFADVLRGPLRLLLSGPTSSGARATPDDAKDAGRNRIHLVVDDLDAEIARLRHADLSFRSDLVSGPGGRQILLADPDGNLIELFEPAPADPSDRSPAGNRPSTSNPAGTSVSVHTQGLADQPGWFRRVP
jgi:catechol 2,3-dioxygenase-like lactoylglutathione lyase family enzyme